MTQQLPLDGLLVVTLEQAVAAPFCTSRLADAGARVIKVERDSGDFARNYDRAASGESAFFAWLNRGKQSLVLDIKAPQDAALLQRIVARADVFVQNLAPGAASRAGFDAAQLRDRNARLVTCDISGYGESAEYGDMKAYDMLVQAESGMCSITGSAEAPGRIGVSACDISCGMFAYMGVVEALLQRERTGAGSAVATSLFEGMSDWMTVPLLCYEGLGKGPDRTGLSHPMIQPYGAYATAAGPPILISVQNEREFGRLCTEVLEQPELLTDERFKDNPARCENTAELREVINGVFTGMARSVLIERLRGAAIAFGEVNDVAGLSNHPAIRRTEVQTPTGMLNLVAPPVRFAGRELKLGPVPALGEHSAAIRSEFYQ